MVTGVRARRRDHHDRVIGWDAPLRILEHGQPVGLDAAIARKGRNDVDVAIGKRTLHESRLELAHPAEPQAIAVTKIGPLRTELGRAAGSERVWPYVETPGGEDNV